MTAQRDTPDVATNPDPGRARKMRDEVLCMHLLAGYDPPNVSVNYPKAGSDEERQGRRALSRYIRDAMPATFVRELLACAIDPDTPSDIPGMSATRSIEFAGRDRGPQSNWVRDLLIVDCIRADLREQGREKDRRLQNLLDQLANPRADETRSEREIRAELRRVQEHEPQWETVWRTVKERFGIGRTAAQNIWKAREQMKEDWLRRDRLPANQ